MAIKIKNLYKSYKGKKVINDLSLEIEDGTISCIMGPSGSGKTTLLNIILGVEVPDSGRVLGIEDRNIAVVFQEDRLCEGFTGKENVKLVLKKKVSSEEIYNNFYEVGLEDIENKKVSELSGGMKRRVAIVRALMAQSDIIIMDEPLKGLDVGTKLKVIKYIKKNCEGKTLIFTSHDMEEVKLLEASIYNLK